MDYASSLLGLLPGGRRTPGLKELLASTGRYLAPEQVERIRAAAEFGASAHQGQKRLSGEPFIAHPVAAAAILADLRLDADTIVAAILHDVIEDTPTPKDQLAARFGADVAELVDGVTKLDQIKFKSREEAQAESFRKMLLAMVRDLRVILVKLADRTHNMRTIEAMALARRRAIARETLEIYAPIAERLGLYNMKLELEDLGFKALYPRRYQVLERTLKRARGNQKEFLKKIEQQLKAALLKSNIQAQVETREKHLYSIYKKMQRKRSLLNEIVDVYGIRIVVDTPDTCYRALGAVHAVFKPMPGTLQGLHRDSARQRLPVAAHDAVRSERRADRGADAHRRHAPGSRVRHRRALEVQDRRRRRQRLDAAGAHARVAVEPGVAAGGGLLGGVPRERQGRPVPRQGVRVHAQGPDPAPAAQRHRGRLRLRRAHRHRQSLRRRQGRPAADAAAHRAAQRPDGRDHHRQAAPRPTRRGSTSS